jgi:aconitate hydratase
MCNKVAEHLTGDPECYANPEKYFDQVIEIDLSKLEPHINGPFTPDLAWPLSKFAAAVKKNKYPAQLEVGLIGSCTNSSYEDLTRAARSPARPRRKTWKSKAEFTITPGSEQIRFTAERDGLLNDFEEIGGVVLANACGPCIGQWAAIWTTKTAELDHDLLQPQLHRPQRRQPQHPRLRGLARRS